MPAWLLMQPQSYPQARKRFVVDVIEKEVRTTQMEILAMRFQKADEAYAYARDHEPLNDYRVVRR
jgi:hypothetical protein